MVFDTFAWQLAEPERIAGIPGVLGTGFGVRVKDSIGEMFPVPVVKVYVVEKRSEGEVPEELRIPPRARVLVPGSGGTPEVLELTTDVVALGGPADALLPPGVGFPGQACAGHMIDGGGPPGTLGCLATRRSTGDQVLVSCHHVLIGGGGPHPPGPVLPGNVVRMDLPQPNQQPTQFDRPVGEVLTAARQDLPVHLDVAVARITRDPASGGPIRKLRRMPRHPSGYVKQGENFAGRVIKVGAATLVTCGSVTSRTNELVLPGGRRVGDVLIIEHIGSAPCTLCPVPHPSSPISLDGDSGAVWITDEPEPRVVGLHWGGGGGGRLAYATPWASIEGIAALDVTIT